MQKVIIIGSGGAGKSTFAARLSRETGLPLIHLDRLYWRPGWVETPKAEWARTVEQIIAADRWIMDGNYGGTLDLRIAACDMVIFLDLPRTTCVWRVIRRQIRFHGRSRPDMAEGCPEKLDWIFLRWIWNYPKASRPKIVERLAALAPGQRAVVLRSASEVEDFFRTLRDTRRA